ncbi:MAG TPA: rhomboid family intramembrane serine protease [Vicinamibacterales bacterium]|nr:rhomboid family intramembrane serine protease [Vicinamibacterales bacterium]
MGRNAPPQLANLIGPGRWTPAVRAIILTNIAVFVLTLAMPDVVIGWLGLVPQEVIEQLRVWQLATYLFVHSPQDVFHILFNMLAVWMFGTDLERRWGTRAFVNYYFVCGVGAGLSMTLVSLVPWAPLHVVYEARTIGASGAVYGLILAWALIFPYRQILFMLFFPIPARVFAFIMGAIALVSAISASGGPVANLAHLGGMLIGWLYLKGPRNLQLDFKYRLTKWRMDRLRRRFNVHRGGRDDDWEHRVH